MKLKQSLCERTQAADAIVVSNPVTALWAVAYAIRNLYPQQAWILPRLDCVRIPRFGTSSPSSLRNILDDANVLVREIGSIQECTFDDFQTAFQSAPSNLLISSLNSLHSHEYRAYRQAAQKAQEGKDIFTVELLMDGILEPMNIPPSLATKIGEQWSKGVDLILTPTDGWIGLQEGCLLLTKFKDDRWDAIVKLIGGLGLEACAATRICLLDSMQDAATSEAWSRTPLGQIVSTSLDNLKNRAQRIAVQINGSPRVERVEATSRMCRLGSGIWSQRELESSVLRIEPKGMTPEQCAHWLAASPRPIWCHTCSDHIELVLRTINPDDDRYVVQRFCNELSDSEDRTESSS